MNVIARKFGTLVFVVLIVGVVAGSVMAKRNVQVNFGTVAGHKLALSSAPTAKTPAVTAGAAGATASSTASAAASTSSAANQTAARPTTGTVEGVSGSTITVTMQDGTTAKALVSSDTAYVKNTTLTLADIKVGDTATVVGQPAADGGIVAQQVTTGMVTQAAAAGAGARFGGAGGQARGSGATQAATGGTARSGSAQASGFTTLTGTVQKVDSTGITLTAPDGQMTAVTIAANARLRQATPASLADVTTGAQVTITGQPAADGSITATAVVITAPS